MAKVGNLDKTISFLYSFKTCLWVASTDEELQILAVLSKWAINAGHSIGLPENGNNSWNSAQLATYIMWHISYLYQIAH